MKKYNSGEKLQNRELNLVLRNTERGELSFQRGRFRKYYPDFKHSPENLELKLKFSLIGNILDR